MWRYGTAVLLMLVFAYTEAKTIAARIPPGWFATRWSRHGAACDSWGSERTGQVFSYGNRCSSVAVGCQFLASGSPGRAAASRRRQARQQKRCADQGC
jgi:hypothetical protein